MQLNALRRLVTHAFAASPYYRESWQELGLNPDQLGSLGAFRRWPLTDRDTIRTHRFHMRACPPGRRLLSKSTGGSSGVPLHFDLDTDSHDRRGGAWYRGYNWASGPGTKQLYLWGTSDSARVEAVEGRPLQPPQPPARAQLVRPQQGRPGVPGGLNAYRPTPLIAYTNPLYTSRGGSRNEAEALLARSIVVGAEQLHPFQRD
jgi:phenylacetate-CoA ligase